MQATVFKSKQNTKYLGNSKYYTSPSKTGIKVEERLMFLGNYYGQKVNHIKDKENKKIDMMIASSPRTTRKK
jgi:hypothetical protein